MELKNLNIYTNSVEKGYDSYKHHSLIWNTIVHCPLSHLIPPQKTMVPHRDVYCDICDKIYVRKDCKKQRTKLVLHA